jgi:hypothetical protein
MRHAAVRSVLPLAALLGLGAACPSRTGPRTPAAGGAAAPPAVPLAGPLDSDEAAASLVPVDLAPGEAAIVVHCSAPDGWAAAVPLELVDLPDDELARALLRLGRDPAAAAAERETRLVPHAARSCSPDGVLRVAPGSYELLVVRGDRLAGPECADNAWIDIVDVAAGDRLEYYLAPEDFGLDLPCPE